MEREQLAVPELVQSLDILSDLPAWWWLTMPLISEKWNRHSLLFVVPVIVTSWVIVGCSGHSGRTSLATQRNGSSSVLSPGLSVPSFTQLSTAQYSGAEWSFHSDDSLAATSVPAAEAVANAAGQFEPPPASDANGQPTVITAVLGRFSHNSYGRHVQPDGSVSSAPYQNHPAWLVSYTAQTLPIIGPIGYQGPSTYTATLRIVIDATSGNYIMALSDP